MMSVDTPNMKQLIAYVPASFAAAVNAACQNLNCSQSSFTHLALILLVQHAQDDQEFVSEMLKTLRAESEGKRQKRAFRRYYLTPVDEPKGGAE